MRFIEKYFSYIISFVLFVHISYAQTSFSPQILLTQEKNNQTTHAFYAFEDNTLTFNEIIEAHQWQRKWEYKFLNNKNIELIAMNQGDISGNGKLEIVVTTYSFGAKAEIYIFQTDGNLPTGPPTIYTLPNLQTGTKPTQADLIAWDVDKDKEIILSVSSPERKIIILDYIINKLKTLTSLAQEFMLNTYGPTEFIVEDYNKDNVDDIIILNNSNQPSAHTIISNQTSFDNPLNIEGQLRDFNIVNYNNEQQEIGINQSGELIFLLENFIVNSPYIFNKIIGSAANNILLLSTDNQIIQATITENKDLIIKDVKPSPLQSAQQTQHISNQSKTHILLTNSNPSEAILVSLLDSLTITPLNYIQQGPITKKTTPKNQGMNTENITSNSLQTTQKNQPTANIVLYDTLFVNINEKLEISIETDFNIHSVETIDRPEGIVLEPKSLQFLWTPTPEQAGLHPLKYNITYNIDTILETNLTQDEQLSLNSRTEQKQEQHQYIIFVNDKPEIYFETPQDTVRPPTNLTIDYTIIDEHFRSEPQLEVLGYNSPNIQVLDNQILWALTAEHAGENRLYFTADDGMLADTTSLQIYVDTTSQIIVYDQHLIATVGKEFIYKIPISSQKQTYNIIQAPNNLRISDHGTIHWIPIMSQLDMNEIIIETLTQNSRETHTLNIYVNFIPLISYRPAQQEHIIKGDTLQFNLQSFDMNLDAQLTWASKFIIEGDTTAIVSNDGILKILTQDLLDNQNYTISLSDQIEEDQFTGFLYVNDVPQIISKPIDYLLLGDTLQYDVIVVDKNLEKPFLPNQKNQLIYTLEQHPLGAQINNTGQIRWIPTKEQIGQNSFKIQISDSLSSTHQNFSIFVNDSPSIVSEDSLSIQVGDTLFHTFGVQDLNNNTDLLYNIKTTINELLFSGKQGKLTWVPTIEEIGLHTLEISVSDGFNLSEDTQKLKIFVYDLPELTNKPPKEAFINMPYKYSPKGKDMFQDSLYNVDIFTNIVSLDSAWTGQHNLANNQLVWTPTPTEPLSQTLIISITDKYGHNTQKRFDVTLLMSPCENTDSLSCPEIDTVYIEKPQLKDSNQKKQWRPKTFSPFSGKQ